MSFIYLELPKFTKTIEQLETQFDKWLFLLKHLSALDAPPQMLQEGVFRQLFEVAEIARCLPEEKDAYNNSLKHHRDLQNVVETSREEGRKEGQKEIQKDATVRFVVRILEKRFGALPRVIQSTIRAMSLDALEILNEGMLDFSGLYDLETWLKARSS